MIDNFLLNIHIFVFFIVLTFYTIKLLIVTITKGLALVVYENLKNDNSVGYGVNYLSGALLA